MRYIFTSLFLCTAIAAIAQEHRFSGNVKDKMYAPAAAVTVTLLQAADSAWVRSEFTDDKGDFVFEKVKEGKYIVDVQGIGYVPTKVPVEINSNNTTVNIAVEKTAGALQQVTVIANKPFIENHAGKMVVNVGSSIAGTGSNALDLLRKSPGVVIDENGNISLKGKQGIVVLINERPTYLSGQQLTDYLRSLPSDDIAQLELITQPSARYDAEGSAGIINIVQKKNKKEGFKGTVTITPGQGIYTTSRNNVNVTWKKDRLNAYANASYHSATGFLRAEYNRNLLDESGNTLTAVDGGVFMKEVFSDALLRTGVDYEMTDKTTVGAMVSANYHPNTQLNQSTDAITDVATGSTFYSKARHEQGFLRKRVMANAYMKNQLSGKQSIVTNADYTHSFRKSRQYLNNSNEDAAGNKLPGNLIVRSWEPSTIDAYSLKSDYSAELSKNTKMEAGVKSSYTVVDNNAMFDKYADGNWIKDDGRTNHFIYKENINAAYVSVNKDLGEKWKMQVGLRMENANISGEQLVNDQTFERSTVSLFPTAYVSCALNKKNEVQLNYGRRIQRPPYGGLNPFPEYISQYHYEIGNPDLKPQMTHNVELSHVYNGGLLTTSVGCSRTNNMINGVVSRDEKQPNVTYNQGRNIAQENNVTMSVTMYKKLLAWWEMSVMGYGFYSDYYDELKDMRRYGNGYGVNLDSQFVFKGGWGAESHISFMGRRREGIYAVAEPAVYTSCGVSKKIFGDSGTLRLNIEDPGLAYIYNWSVNTGDVRASGKIQHNTMHYGLSFIYNFGSGNGKQREATNDEVRRM